jgi:hypothetical protein
MELSVAASEPMASGGGSLTADELRRIAHYDPQTGQFEWFENVRFRKNAAGNKPRSKPVSYFQVTIRGQRYLAHRLAWLYEYGEFPKGHIDHINGDRHDNRLANLREATHQENLYNRGANKNNSTGYKGVSVNRLGRYLATITANGKYHYLGLFDDAETAHQAYCAAALRLHGDFARVA